MKIARYDKKCRRVHCKIIEFIELIIAVSWNKV
jgi:hypothetical protein